MPRTGGAGVRSARSVSRSKFQKIRSDGTISHDFAYTQTRFSRCPDLLTNPYRFGSGPGGCRANTEHLELTASHRRAFTLLKRIYGSSRTFSGTVIGDTVM